MKRLLFLLSFVFIFWGCADLEEDGFVVLDGPILESINRDGNLEFNGALVNTGDTPVRSVYVVVIIRDENGKIMEATSTSVLGEDPEALLYPSERVFFTVTTKFDPGIMASKDVEIYYEEAPDLPPSS